MSYHDDFEDDGLDDYDLSKEEYNIQCDKLEGESDKAMRIRIKESRLRR